MYVPLLKVVAYGEAASLTQKHIVHNRRDEGL